MQMMRSLKTVCGYLASMLILFSTSAGLTAPNPSNESGKPSIFDLIDQHLYFVQDTAEVNTLLHQTKDLYRKVNQSDSLAMTYNRLFIYHDLFGDLDSAIYYLELAQLIYLNKKDAEVIAETYLKLKELYSGKADYTMAMNKVFKALDIYTRTDNQKGIAICYSQLCDLLYYEDNYEEGVSWCDQAIAIQKVINAPLDLAESYHRKASNLLFIDGELENALATINQSIAIYQESGATEIPLMTSINTRGNIYKHMERYDDALVDYWSNYRTSMTKGIFRYAIPSLGNIGHVYILLGAYERALPYHLEAIQIMHDTGNTRNLWENYMHVSLCYEMLHQYEKALAYHKLYTIEYSNYQRTMIERLEYGLKIKYETEKNEETIYKQAARITQQYKVQALYISIAGLLIIVLAGMFFSINSIRKKRTVLQQLNQELDTRNQQNEILLKEIHHRVKNNLEMVKSLISLQSAQMEESEIKDVMVASQNRVQSMGIIHQKLYLGKNLGSIEMKDYFISLGEGIADTFHSTDQVTIECAMDTIELDIDTAIPIGLIVNELLTNSLKYAFPDKQKGTIIISLFQQNQDTLVLSVSDNGIGKTYGLTNGTGFGTQLIGLLTQQLDGNITEHNTGGTSILIHFKLNIAA